MIVCTIDIKIFQMCISVVKKYRLCDVYKYFDVGDSTVRKRYYKQKLRGWELVYGKGKVPVEIEQGKGIGEW